MKVRRVLAWLAGGAICFFALVIAAAYFLAPNCAGDSPGAEFARSIPGTRLRMVFDDVRRLGPFVGRREVPDEFSDLGVIAIGGASLPGSARLRLEGCFDHHLDLVVIGADGESRGEPRIELIWGEVPYHGSEVLWRLSDG